MRREWDDRERGEQQAAYRAHLRALTEARQAAERCRAQLRRGGAAARREADHVFRTELARIEAEHQVWLREHLPDYDPPDKQHEPRSRRGGTPG